MLISLSISVRHSPWFHEINIHLLLMALMHVLHHKNSRASPPTAGSWAQHMGDTCRHMDTKRGDECKHRMKCFLLIKMFLCLVETVKDVSAKYALCLQRKVFDVGSKWYGAFSPSSWKLANVISEPDNQNMSAVETKNKVKRDLIIHPFCPGLYLECKYHTFNHGYLLSIPFFFFFPSALSVKTPHGNFFKFPSPFS